LSKRFELDEEKLGSLSVIKDLANGNCCKISETLFSIFSLLWIYFMAKYFESIQVMK